MEKNLDNTQKKPEVVVESSVSEVIPVGKFVDKDALKEDDDEDFDLSLDEPEDDNEDADSKDSEGSVADEIDEEQDDDVKEQQKTDLKKPKSRDQKTNKALKDRAWKLQQENADLKKRLEEKSRADSEAALAQKYVDDGYDEKEAKTKAKADVRQDTIESQLELLMFEKKNRRVLAEYPDSDDDLDRIMTAVRASGMTVEQVCRGLYGDSRDRDREQRAVKGVLGTDNATAQDASVAKSMRSAIPPKKSSLTQDQLRAKRLMEKNFNRGKTISDEDFLKCWNN
jgi:hypothetical protein